MMKFHKKYILLLLLIIFSSLMISALPFSNLFNNSETLIVVDNTSSDYLPSRYRNITSLNISGSSQFTPPQFETLVRTINLPNICVIDLRQESHGFVNDIAISFYNPFEDLNNGFTSLESIEAENQLLSRIKIGSTLKLYKKTGRLFDSIIVNSVSNEDSLVLKYDCGYERFAVKDGGIPTPTVVDNFVDFIKTVPSDLHLHFHCDAGEGRTTMFMSLFQIMNNTNNLSLDQILTYQYNIGGIILKEDYHRTEFLNEFFNYVQENKCNNYMTPYSKWIKQ